MLSIKKEKEKKNKFTKDLLDKYDAPAREIVKTLLGDAIRDNKNIYAEDMVFTIDQFPYKYLELQVFAKWNCDIFPYNYPFVYARKMKFAKNTLFATFNKSLTQVILFSRDDISNTPSKLKKYDRESVHYVAWNNTMKVSTCNLSINLIKCFSGDIDELN